MTNQSEGKTMSDSCFFYLRLTDRTPVGTVALRRTKGGFTCAASLCHEADEWNRRTAINKAMGRLESPSYSTDVDGAEFLGDVLLELGIDWPRHATWRGERWIQLDIGAADAMFKKQCAFLAKDHHLQTDEPKG